MKNLSDLNSNEFQTFMGSFDAVMFDCDGVLWHASQMIPEANTLVKDLRKDGKKVFFLTNNSTKTRDQLLQKLNQMGFESNLDEILGSSYLTAQYLKSQNFTKKVFVVGTTGITHELEAVGIQSLPIGPDALYLGEGDWVDHIRSVKLEEGVGAVVVGFDPHLSYLKLYRATSYLSFPEVQFIATNTDENLPEGSGLVLPGTGSIVQAVVTASGRQPVIMGKPNPYAFEFVKKMHNVEPSRILMVGDRANTDILFGRKCGMQTLLVETGVTSASQAAQYEKSKDPEIQCWAPHFHTQSVTSFSTLIKTTHNNL